MTVPVGSLLLCVVLTLFVCQVRTEAEGYPALTGFQVLESASHYWPLDTVAGLNELCNVNGSQTDIVEGVVKKGIYLNGNTDGTFLHFGSYKNSCISDPAQCSDAGVTFSFFWKNLEKWSGSTITSAGKVLSSGFSIYASVDGGYIEFYTRNTLRRWKAMINPPGPEWTHILFTWTSGGGLKIYVNGTFSTNDTYGKVAVGNENQYANLAGRKSDQPYRRYVTGSFDEFVIWERALTPYEIQLYYNATTGPHGCQTETASISGQGQSDSRPVTTDVPLSTVTYSPRMGTPAAGTESRQSPVTPDGFLDSSLVLPNETLPHYTASNLTENFLQTVGEVLALPSWSGTAESVALVSGLIGTVDKVMTRVASSLEGNPSSAVSIEGSSEVADYSLAKVPDASSLTSYRFPARGMSYILVPGEAFHRKTQTTIVGLLYHTMHQYYKQIDPLQTKISESAFHKDHKITVMSYIISLKMEPPPSLSHNLSGFPLSTLTLSHVLTPSQYQFVLNKTSQVYLWCAFLDFSSGSAVWSNEGCIRIGGNISYSICLCNHLTNFAILMQVVPLELEQVHQVALSAITYIGCSLSIVCLMVTLIIFAVLSSVSAIRNQRYHIHANLSFAILVAQVLLLISFRFVPGTLPCKALAILLHFFFLSVFSWMLVEGLHLYSMVIKVFGSEESKHFYYYGIGWGSPLVICIVSVTSAFGSYGNADNCWLSIERGAIWAFVAPALFVIVVNVGILIAVTRIISRISADNYKIHRDANAFRLTAKAVAVLLPILGISWACGVLTVNNYAIVFQYIFALFNSFQGFFIFLFHCLLNSEVRAALKHKTKVWSLNSSSMRNVNVKPFNSDIMNGNRAITTPTKLNTWEKSTEFANRMDLSAV
ncbi:adhesion G-protein coupled receptor D1 isoform X2 [Stegostoma tigrinum]|uniref:adhesion G-protein coupled receptor D1 isoform X2 n=2 Tax=Stegostoma tigrinum TaxID=3053191 RepID=UPI0028704068|nr:adhesion G-protein coupled receptor D1 isoform X2 [Stegostoma tigrinum]